jgi:hypothetical protein
VVNENGYARAATMSEAECSGDVDLLRGNAESPPLVCSIAGRLDAAIPPGQTVAWYRMLNSHEGNQSPIPSRGVPSLIRFHLSAVSAVEQATKQKAVH